MDRDKRWDRVEKAYDAIVDAKGEAATTPRRRGRRGLCRQLDDEFVLPTVIGGYRRHEGRRRPADVQLPRRPRARDPDGAARSGASTASARDARELRRCRRHGRIFRRAQRLPHDAVPARRHQDGPGRDVARRPASSSCASPRPRNTRTSPSSSTAARSAQFAGEERILVPSPKVATYDLQPEMSAPEVTDKLVAAIGSGKYDLIVVNFANPDMVGHTGILRCGDQGGRSRRRLPRPSDGGGAEGRRRDARHRRPRQCRADARRGKPSEAHRAHAESRAGDSVQRARNIRSLSDGKLADVAPTLLALMHMPQPREMTGLRCCRRPPRPHLLAVPRPAAAASA